MARLTKDQVNKFKMLQEQVKALTKELDKQKQDIMKSLEVSNSNFAHIETSNRQIVDNEKLKKHGLFDDFSKVIECKSLKLDI